VHKQWEGTGGRIGDPYGGVGQVSVITISGKKKGNRNRTKEKGEYFQGASA